MEPRQGNPLHNISGNAILVMDREVLYGSRCKPGCTYVYETILQRMISSLVKDDLGCLEFDDKKFITFR